MIDGWEHSRGLDVVECGFAHDAQSQHLSQLSKALIRESSEENGRADEQITCPCAIDDGLRGPRGSATSVARRLDADAASQVLGDIVADLLDTSTTLMAEPEQLLKMGCEYEIFQIVLSRG